MLRGMPGESSTGSERVSANGQPDLAATFEAFLTERRPFILRGYGTVGDSVQVYRAALAGFLSGNGHHGPDDWHPAFREHTAGMPAVEEARARVALVVEAIDADLTVFLRLQKAAAAVPAEPLHYDI